MSKHELTEEEKFSQRSKEELDLWNRVFAILEDIEVRLSIIENKSK